MPGPAARTWRYHRDTRFGTSTSASIVAAIAGDLDADGHVEIYTSGPDGIARWVRASSGAWESSAVAGTAGLADSVQLALADVDGDGKKDLLVGQFSGGKIRVYKNLGDGKLAAGEWLKTGGAVAEVPGVW